MKRIIVDYTNLNEKMLNLLLEKYPEGYEYNDILRFQTSKGETIKAIEIRTEDSIYLIKVSAELDRVMNQDSIPDVDEDFSFDDIDTQF